MSETEETEVVNGVRLTPEKAHEIQTKLMGEPEPDIIQLAPCACCGNVGPILTFCPVDGNVIPVPEPSL